MIDLRMGRGKDGLIRVYSEMRGTTDVLLDELVAGCTDVLLRIADDLPTQDQLHEELARVMVAEITERVSREIRRREETEDKTPEA